MVKDPVTKIAEVRNETRETQVVEQPVESSYSNTYSNSEMLTAPLILFLIISKKQKDNAQPVIGI